MNPIVPGFSSSPAKLERTVKAIADHGARFLGCNVMFLEDGTRTHFMKFLEREFPLWLPRYTRLYEKKYAPVEYRKQVQGLIRLLQQRYGVPARVDVTHDAGPGGDAGEGGTGGDGGANGKNELEQVGFRW
jgi:DNA repair photolyase